MLGGLYLGAYTLEDTVTPPFTGAPGYITASDILAGDGSTRDAYQPDNVIRISTSIYSFGGFHADPATLELRIMIPNGTIDDHVIGDLTKDQQGIYHIDILATTPGQWLYRVASTNPVADTGDLAFQVAASRFTSPPDAA